MKTEGISSTSPVRPVEHQNPRPGDKAKEVSQFMEKKQGEGKHFPGEKQLIEAIEKSNEDLELSSSSLRFSIHEKTKQIMVKVIDNETEEVIREIPPEKILDMVAAMLERTGLFVDKKI